MSRTFVAVLMVFWPCLIGCGGGSDKPALIPVQGTVLLNGSPVEGATVTFSCDKAPRAAIGVTDASGKFRLTSYDTNDGAVAGEHIVTISKAAEAAQSTMLTQENAKEMMEKNTGMMKGGNLADMKPKTVLPAKYADPKTSGEKRTVSAGDTNDFKFDLTAE